MGMTDIGEREDLLPALLGDGDAGEKLALLSEELAKSGMVPAESKYIRYRSLFDVFKQSHRMVYAPDGCSHARSTLFEADRIQPASKSAGPGRRPDPPPAIGADPAIAGEAGGDPAGMGGV